jgi:hypothetical protein
VHPDVVGGHRERAPGRRWGRASAGIGKGPGAGGGRDVRPQRGGASAGIGKGPPGGGQWHPAPVRYWKGLPGPALRRECADTGIPPPPGAVRQPLSVSGRLWRASSNHRQPPSGFGRPATGASGRPATAVCLRAAWACVQMLPGNSSSGRLGRPDALARRGTAVAGRSSSF